MKSFTAAICLAFLPGLMAQHSMDHGTRPAPRLAGMGNVDHPIVTSSREAQAYFNQGLNLVFGFNHEEAVRAFERAAQLDPKSPVPWWGKALALGPNIN